MPDDEVKPFHLIIKSSYHTNHLKYCNLKGDTCWFWKSRFRLLPWMVNSEVECSFGAELHSRDALAVAHWIQWHSGTLAK